MCEYNVVILYEEFVYIPIPTSSDSQYSILVLVVMDHKREDGSLMWFDWYST
jgi:hypothetical protein